MGDRTHGGVVSKPTSLSKPSMKSYSSILDADNTFVGEVIKGDVSTGDKTAGNANDGDTIWQRILIHGPQLQLSFSVRTPPY